MGTTAPICLHTLKIGNRASGVDTHRKEHDRPLPRLVRRGAYRFALLYRIALRALLLRAPFKNGEPCFDLAMSVPVEEGATLAVSSVSGRLGVDSFSVDYLSGAVIHTGKGDRWIKIQDCLPCVTETMGCWCT